MSFTVLSGYFEKVMSQYKCITRHVLLTASVHSSLVQYYSAGMHILTFSYACPMLTFA